VQPNGRGVLVGFMELFQPATGTESCTIMSELRQVRTSLEWTETPPVSLSCTVYETFDGLDYLRDAWDEVVLRTSGSIYMTYDWVRLWWKFYGGSAKLKLFVFTDGERLLGIVPIYIDTLGWGPLRLRVARLVGANIPPKVFNPPVPRACAEDVLGEVVRQTIGSGCDLLSFGPVCESEGWATQFHGLCTDGSRRLVRGKSACGVHSVFELPGKMEEYYSALSPSERKNRRYYLRLLQKEYDTKVEITSDPASVVREFDWFAEQHKRQWYAQGQSGHFGGWPRALAFNRSLVEAQGKSGRLRFIRILANGEVISRQYIFAFAERFFWELPARAVDAKWDRFNVGNTAVVILLAQAMAEGIHRVQAGLGHYDYKVRLGAKEYPVVTYRIVAAGVLARTRFALFSLVRNCVCVVYHKMWYRRLVPGLPTFFVRPQWRWWLRLDF
jgi:CelD/BcsL family acetyltransferase involved in cellulose biosynthesis